MNEKAQENVLINLSDQNRQRQNSSSEASVNNVENVSSHPARRQINLSGWEGASCRVS